MINDDDHDDHFVGMVMIPLIMNKLDQRGLFKKYPKANAPLQVFLVGLILTFATPLCCAIFEQKASIAVKDTEQSIQDKVRSLANPLVNVPKVGLTCTKCTIAHVMSCLVSQQHVWVFL